jgi:hypothetical protein
VGNVVVRILKVKEKAKLLSMYLYLIFVMPPPYTVFIFNIIFGDKIHTNVCVQNLSHSSAVQVTSLVPL